jgi:hypothetical protein
MEKLTEGAEKKVGRGVSLQRSIQKDNPVVDDSMGLMQDVKCSGCRPSPEDVNAELAGMPFPARRSAAMSLQKSLGNRFVQGLAVQAKKREDEELMQGKFASRLIGTLQAKEEAPPNKTGIPDQLKSGIESISGMDLSDVRVHYNSSEPAQLNALAYTQGQEIHVASGQEKHLPHEAWHAVQQAQGRVKPTMQLKDGIPINDEEDLEHEADEMGAKALTNPAQLQGASEETDPIQLKFASVKHTQDNQAAKPLISGHTPPPASQVQRMVYQVGNDKETTSTVDKVKGPKERLVDTTTSGLPFYRHALELFSSGLKTNEELKIVGHGSENGTIGGVHPIDLVNNLIKQGLDPAQHKGDINLTVCLSGHAIDGFAIADTFCWYLRLNGFTNRVIGYDGYVHADPNGNLMVVPPDNQDIFIKAKQESERLDAIDADAIFDQMVMIDKKPMKEYQDWERVLVDDMIKQKGIMENCYVRLSDRPELRRVVNFPEIKTKEEMKIFRREYIEMMKKKQPLPTQRGSQGETSVTSLQLYRVDNELSKKIIY